MKDLINLALAHKADIASGASVVYLTCHRIYTYVCDKGGLRTMLSNFLGPKQPQAAAEQPTQQNEKPS